MDELIIGDYKLYLLVIFHVQFQKRKDFKDGYSLLKTDGLEGAWLSDISQKRHINQSHFVILG